MRPREPETIPVGSIGAGFLAGILSTLSPCVLPILPLVLDAAASAHRAGAVMLALGMALSITAVGLFVATVGFTIGLDGDLFRTGSAIMLDLIEIVLLSKALLIAAQGKDPVGVAAVMLAFGVGAALPLLLIAALSRQAIADCRGRC